MNRSLTFLALTLLAALCLSAPAQTRRTGAQPARPTPRTQTPAPTTPARPNTTAPANANTTAKTDEDCGCDAGPLPGVLAIVNGVRVTDKDLSASTEAQVHDYEQQMAIARMGELDHQINARLLDAEAKRRGITPDKLYETEVVAHIAMPTEAEVQAAFVQNRAAVEAQVGHAVELKDLHDEIVNDLLAKRRQEQESLFAARLRIGAQYQVLVSEVTPATNAGERARVLANVNGQPITAGNVADALRPLTAQVREQIYELRRNDLDLKINDILLQQEAQKRQATAEAVYNAEIAARSKPVTDADAQAYFNKNREQVLAAYGLPNNTSVTFAQVKEQLLEDMKRDVQSQASGALAAELRRKANVQIFLQPPQVQIAIDDQPMRGNQTAGVTIVEFTDFQCPSCAAAQPVLERIMTEYGTRVRLVVRDFPLAQHKSAFKAAEAAEAAREQGKYWEYAALLFKNQAAVTPMEQKEAALAVPKLKEYASQLGLDRQRFDAALDSGRFAAKVQRDQQDGNNIGVHATPSIFINGRYVSAPTYEEIKAALDAALAAK